MRSHFSKFLNRNSNSDKSCLRKPCLTGFQRSFIIIDSLQYALSSQSVANMSAHCAVLLRTSVLAHMLVQSFLPMHDLWDFASTRLRTLRWLARAESGGYSIYFDTEHDNSITESCQPDGWADSNSHGLR